MVMKFNLFRKSLLKHFFKVFCFIKLDIMSRNGLTYSNVSNLDKF